MMGLVIVAHSHRLAEGVRELAEQMSRGKVAIATAGGLDEATIGTSPERIARAIEAVSGPDGVLVLMDLGSALLSAEMALELLPPERGERVVLSEAPLVEGAVAAAAVAAAGATLEEAAAEARAALDPKRAQLATVEPSLAAVSPAEPGTPPEAGPGPQAVRTGRTTLVNPLGLHARPAARLVEAAARFKAAVRVRNATRGAGPVNARSINAVALLDARQGDELVVEAEGPEAEQAVTALTALVASGFGEVEPARAAVAQPATQPVEAPGAAGEPPYRGTTVLRGVRASPGIALGPAVALRPARPAVPRQRVADDPDAELRRLEQARRAGAAELAALGGKLAATLGRYEAAIFDAHRAFLDDPELLEGVERAIRQEGLSAEAAWERQLTSTAERYRALDNPVLKGRATDLEDVRDRVLLALAATAGAGGSAPGPDEPALPAEGPEPGRSGVLVAGDLTPSQVARLDPGRVLAVVTAAGSATSHAMVLARSMGLPAVVGVGRAVLGVPDGAPLGVDGERGVVVVEPDAASEAELRRRRETWLARRRRAHQTRHRPAVTTDGRRVEVAANAGSLEDARAAREAGADGIGLLRTEFLFLDREQPPDESEQVSAYRAIAEAVAPHPVIIRTLDVGGDKPVRYLETAAETNPFLGIRGLRVSLAHPELFRTQLRAILRAASAGRVRLMFPMVATPEELAAALEHLAAARVALRRAGDPAAESGIEVGIMVEVPSAALLAGHLARQAEFFSLGTNDLTQYVMAAERGNPGVAALSDPLHPAVLRLVDMVVRAAHDAGRWVGVCGEMAGDPVAVPILVGLGIDELSAAPVAVPGAKAVIRRLDTARAGQVARAALEAPDAEGVRAMVRREFPVR